MSAYYNEFDPYAAQWLRNLIARNLIAPGDVDERSILEVQADDLRDYDQCHFFAGIGGWSYALRLAGWPDDRPVWTGSCPCQPFSTAGKQRGSEDERHLWPAFFDLIRQRRPASVFGEQVAGASGLAWLDHVCADLEGAEYAAAAADLCAAGAGAPHIRQRLYWVAKSNEGEWRPWRDAPGFAGRAQPEFTGSGVTGGVADTECRPAERRGHDMAATPRSAEGEARERERLWDEPGPSSNACDLADAPQGGQRIDWCAPRQAGYAALSDTTGLLGNAGNEGLAQRGGFPGILGFASGSGEGQAAERAGIHLDAWADIEWLQCSDGKARPTQSGLFPLAHGVQNRVGRLRAYGNAIVPQVAAAFVLANEKVSGCLRDDA